jgi:hypothetical protein
MAGTAGTAIARGIPTARYPSTYKLYALGVPHPSGLAGMTLESL